MQHFWLNFWLSITIFSCVKKHFFGIYELVQVSNGLLPDAATVPSSFLAVDVNSH